MGYLHNQLVTVEGYRDALFLKLDIKTRIGLVLYALKEELVLLGHLEK